MTRCIDAQGRVGSVRRGFTLVELMVASMIVALVLAAVATSIAQVGRARSTAKVRLEAHRRAAAALENLRRDVESAMRSDDLFNCRVLILDGAKSTPAGRLDRDELLIFNNRLRPSREIHYNGEGIEYETQYRVEEDDLGSALWQRRDAVPDTFPEGGGMATPLVDGIVGVSFQAYDGTSWFDTWDSDEDGLPWAIRMTIVASGMANGEDVFSTTTPMVTLRTLVAIDRVGQPYEEPTEEEILETGGDLDGDGVVSPEEQAAVAAASGAVPSGPGEIAVDGNGMATGGAPRGGKGGAGGRVPMGGGGAGGPMGGGPRGGNGFQGGGGGGGGGSQGGGGSAGGGNGSRPKPSSLGGNGSLLRK
ncbi:MAG: prepilin-type N-terminal cleavage/methylation domain-containing protein [Phycisphaerales bacterium]|nr:prepilin-type N-terminal cleavage/methylation domain-containing protein [Phycisphaerales bacterium]